jgi:hypothetical protein
MLTHLKTKLNSGDLKAAQQYRQLTIYPPLTQTAKKYQATISRTGKTWPNAATDPTSLLLQEQLKQYTAFNQQQQPLQPQVIRVNQTELVYTKPILMTNALCLRCHGEPANTLTTAQKGHQAGSWAGMWYVQFRAKGILDSITQKRKKSRRGSPDSTKK